ncbi:Rab escort protein [Forsythia ovata]|uniref:Rab escort protein 1 n=1 Tax=Forsythia ovata TaxID=205694 RepID=A0ABD1TMW8_9LAMI
MEEMTAYPHIEPSNFDLIIVGTGLPESILAAASSAAGKAVLQLDPNSSYGTHYASLLLQDFIIFLQSQSSSTLQVPQTDDGSGNYVCVPLITRPLYSSLEINSYSSEPLDNSRKFCLDLTGPRVLLCSDPMIDLILKTGINQYMEFKSVDASFTSNVEGHLVTVPDSRSAIFKDRSLSFTEKNQLMRFFKLVQGHFLSESKGDQCDRISEEDLESPFVEFLTKLGLSQKLKWIILYAIVMANYDQDNMEVCKDVIKTKDGINHLTLYHSSVGRFPNANGAMIYPLYGQGELPQAFCRRAAVKGCIHVLRMPVIALLMDKDSGTYKGVKLVSGQELFSPQLILAPSFTITSPLAPFSSHKLSSHDLDLQDVKEKVARAICITTNSLKPDVANCVVFFPPRSLCPDQTMSVRVFQLSSNVAVCPSGMFVTYLSAVCNSAVEGKKLLHSAINSLFSVSISGKSEKRDIDDQSENTEVKPSLLWSTLYLQELTTGAFESINYMTMPDEHLHYNGLLDTTAKLFQKLYPGEEFFPTTNLSDEFADDAGSELEISALGTVLELKFAVLSAWGVESISVFITSDVYLGMRPLPKFSSLVYASLVHDSSIFFGTALSTALTESLISLSKQANMAAIYSLYIISKSRGLIFYKDYGSAGRMDTNDSLRLASL